MLGVNNIDIPQGLLDSKRTLYITQSTAVQMWSVVSKNMRYPHVYGAHFNKWEVIEIATELLTRFNLAIFDERGRLETFVRANT